MNARNAVFWLAMLALGLAGIGWQALHPVVPGAHDDDAPAAALMAVPEADWSALELIHQGQRYRFERDAQGRWLRHEALRGEAAVHGHNAEASAATRIGEVLATFARTRIDRRLNAPPGRLQPYGLDSPALIVLIFGTGGRVLFRLEAGGMAPDGLSRYVRLPQDGSVLLIANYQIEALLGLLPKA